VRVRREAKQGNGALSVDMAPVDIAAAPRASETRLADAAATSAVFEIVVVLRGTVHRRAGHPADLWRVRLPNGRYGVFSADSVIAVTPVAKLTTASARRNPESGDCG
jgi:hypothetical protein